MKTVEELEKINELLSEQLKYLETCNRWREKEKELLEKKISDAEKILEEVKLRVWKL